MSTMQIEVCKKLSEDGAFAIAVVRFTYSSLAVFAEKSK